MPPVLPGVCGAAPGKITNGEVGCEQRSETRQSRSRELAAATLIVAILMPGGAASSSAQVLYSFCPQIGGADGAQPLAGLIMDAAGNLYGTTFNGGVTNQGVVFALSTP